MTLLVGRKTKYILSKIFPFWRSSLSICSSRGEVWQIVAFAHITGHFTPITVLYSPHNASMKSEWFILIQFIDVQGSLEICLMINYNLGYMIFGWWCFQLGSKVKTYVNSTTVHFMFLLHYNTRRRISYALPLNFYVNLRLVWCLTLSSPCIVTLEWQLSISYWSLLLVCVVLVFHVPVYDA